MSTGCNGSSTGISARRLVLAAGDGVLNVSVAGITGTITIEVPGGGYHKYEIWLSDSATDPSETVSLPSSNIVRWEGYTDGDGEATITFDNSNASQSWYAWAQINKINPSAVITVGV